VAVTRLSDVVVPEVFAAYMASDTTEKADIFQSGLVRMDSSMAANLAGGGRLFQTPYWGDLANTEANVANDDPAQSAVPDKIGSFKSQSVRQFRTQAWSSAQLTAELAGSDPQRRIVSRVSEYWNRQFNRYTVATLTGILAANVANNGSDMVHDVRAVAGTSTIGGVTVNNNALSAASILTAKQSMGDDADMLKVLVMHSALYTNLQRQNLIQYIPNARGEITLPTYLGYRVHVTDTAPAVVVGADIDYTTYLCAEGLIGFAESPPAESVAVDKYPLQGMGAGVEVIVTRRQFALHPNGHNWKDAACAGIFPTTAELANPLNWERKAPERKMVPLVGILTRNG
jgi:hypothetical protein